MEHLSSTLNHLQNEYTTSKESIPKPINPIEALDKILASYKLCNSINKLPRYFNAKIIELIDKFSSSLVYFSLSITMGLEGIFGPSLSHHNLYITLKDCDKFKEWHRELEDVFDDLRKKVQKGLHDFGHLVKEQVVPEKPEKFKTGEESEYSLPESFDEGRKYPGDDVAEFMDHIVGRDFYHSLNGHINDKKNGALARNLFEIGKALDQAHGWHGKVTPTNIGSKKLFSSKDKHHKSNNGIRIRKRNPSSRRRAERSRSYSLIEDHKSK